MPGARVTDPEFATVLGYAALVLILAEGGLTTRWADLRPVLWPSIVLATVGVAVTIVAVAVPLIWLAGRCSMVCSCGNKAITRSKRCAGVA